jgi:hypothetical protein
MWSLSFKVYEEGAVSRTFLLPSFLSSSEERYMTAMLKIGGEDD